MIGLMKIKNVVRFRTLASWLGFLALENVQFMFKPNLFPSPPEVNGGYYLHMTKVLAISNKFLSPSEVAGGYSLENEQNSKPRCSKVSVPSRGNWGVS